MAGRYSENTGWTMDRDMTGYNGPDRRTMGDFEKEMLLLMGEVRQYMANQPGRCSSHSGSITSLKNSVEQIRLAIEFKDEPTDENPNIGVRVGKVETSHGNYRFSCGVGMAWLTGLTSALAALWEALFTHASNNPEVTRQTVETLKRMKGGG